MISTAEKIAFLEADLDLARTCLAATPARGWDGDTRCAELRRIIDEHLDDLLGLYDERDLERTS